MIKPKSTPKMATLFKNVSLENAVDYLHDLISTIGYYPGLFSTLIDKIGSNSFILNLLFKTHLIET